jgi:hypothetical protein
MPPGAGCTNVPGTNLLLARKKNEISTGKFLNGCEILGKVPGTVNHGVKTCEVLTKRVPTSVADP